MMKNVTIVIPVYKDWDTLQLCIESLKQYVDRRHKIILVNDRSNVWEEIESNILVAIKGHENFEYYLNQENMGFVKTCNRAVFELDCTQNDIFLLNSDTKVTEGFLEEMISVLYLYEKHGAVCPRSNNATLLTMPVRNNTGDLLDPEKSYNVFSTMKSVLPRYSIIPTGVGFALLIKRQLIDRFGLFDEAYGMGYNEENDFLARINQYGFNVVMANHAYVYHFESKSFGLDKKLELDSKNSKIFLERYPHYSYMVNRYFNQNILAAEYFADLIAEGIYSKPRVLFDLYEVPSSYNGTAKYALSVFDAFYSLYKDKYDIHVLINASADRFHKLSDKYDNVWHPDNILGTYHIAFSPSQIFHIENLFLLNRVALKYVVCMQDIISIRSMYLLTDDYERLDVFRKSVRYCDGLMSISEFSLNDTLGYYYIEDGRRNIDTHVVYHGFTEDDCAMSNEKLPFDKYFFIFGNFYKHKFLSETLQYLKNVKKYNFIVLGTVNTGHVTDNIYGYKSGNLSDEFVSQLVGMSVGLIFPSVYEGFGLPILDGIKYDKKVIATNTELNRELKANFKEFAPNIELFDDFDELSHKIEEVYTNPTVQYAGEGKVVRNWNDVASDLEQYLERVLSSSVEFDRLQDRWEDMRYLENVHRMYANQGGAGIPEDQKTVVDRLSISFREFKTAILQGMKTATRLIKLKFKA